MTAARLDSPHRRPAPHVPAPLRGALRRAHAGDRAATGRRQRRGGSIREQAACQRRSADNAGKTPSSSKRQSQPSLSNAYGVSWRARAERGALRRNLGDSPRRPVGLSGFPAPRATHRFGDSARYVGSAGYRRCRISVTSVVMETGGRGCSPDRDGVTAGDAWHKPFAMRLSRKRFALCELDNRANRYSLGPRSAERVLGYFFAYRGRNSPTAWRHSLPAPGRVKSSVRRRRTAARTGLRPLANPAN
jgi:hypothetical protein